jgi:hypothetical protein
MHTLIATPTNNKTNNKTNNNTNALTNNASTYIPPNKRKTIQKTTPFTSAEKKEPKKEFSTNNLELFPTLCETMKHSNNYNKAISFSSMASKKVEVPVEIKSDILPGWIHIRKHNGITQYKYGAIIPRIDTTEQDDKYISKIIYNYRMSRQQYERDMDIERLGDLSEYYNAPTLAEIQEEYDAVEEINYNSSSEESDHEY